MNGLSYERMWLTLRHRVASEEGLPGERAAGDSPGPEVFGPCYGLMRDVEKRHLAPKKAEADAEPEAEAKPPGAEGLHLGLTMLYVDFRLMWYELSHAAEADPTVYPKLRDWMVEVEADEMVDPTDVFVSRYAESIMELISQLISGRPQKKAEPPAGGRAVTLMQRLDAITRELVEMTEWLETVTDRTELVARSLEEG